MDFNKKINIGKYELSESSPTFIIAEAGVNHGGNIDVAKQLVNIAKEAGAHAVKFQAFRTENLILKDVEKAHYQQETTEQKESQFEMLKKLELRKTHYKELLEYCIEKEIIFLITPFDEVSLSELEEIGVVAYKVASTDTTNLPFLKKVAKTGKPIILSTGMCFLHEVEAALKEIYPYNKDVILLQCTANYPISDDEANLNVIYTYKKKFNVLVGYSDHSVGLGASLYAIPMGAKIIEKHFTLDKSLEGPDHLASLDAQELECFVKEIRKIETYLGSSLKQPAKSEENTRTSLQKCLVAAKPIRKGVPFTEENIIAKRTGGKGISPIDYKDVINRIAKKDYKVDDIIVVDEE